MQRKGNPNILLVGMQTGTVEHSMEFPQKLKMELSFDPVIPLLGIYPKKSETSIIKYICTHMFIATQFTIVPKCLSADEWIKKSVVHLHNVILCWGQKGVLTFCNNMDGDREHYAK